MRSLICTIFLIPVLALAEGVEVGMPAPPFTLRDLNNRPLAIEDLAYPGPEKPKRPKTIVLLDFFRTDCPPCKKKLPYVIELHRKFKDRGFTVVLVALLEDRDGESKLMSFLSANPVPFPVVIDRHEVAAKRYISLEGDALRLGTMVLVDREGIVRAKTDDERHIEEALLELLHRQ